MEQTEITIGEAYANADDAVAKQTALNATPYPAEEPEPKKATIGERIAAMFRRWHVSMLLAELKDQEKLIADMPEAVENEKLTAKRDYEVRLIEIEGLAAYHTARARLEAHRITSKLARMGVKP